MKIICVGDNVVDCYINQNKYYPGGNCLNVAVNAKRLGADQASYLGVFGTDEKAKHIQKVLEKETIEWSHSRQVKGISGQPRVKITSDGDRIFINSPKDTVQHLVKINLIPNDYDYIKNFDLLHTSCYSYMEDQLPELSKHIPVSFDFSESYTSKYLERVCPYIKYAFLSGSDLSQEQIDELLEELSNYNLEIICITRGEKPAIVVHESKKYFQEPAAVEVKDTMGAGDSFIAGFLVSYFKNDGIEEALKNAALSASETCKHYGGIGYPKIMKE